MATKTTNRETPRWITNMDSEYSFWGETMAELIATGKLIEMPTLAFPKLDTGYVALQERSKKFKAFYDALSKNDRVNAKKNITNVASYYLFEKLGLYDKYREMLQKAYINTVDDVPMDIRKAVLKMKLNDGQPLFDNLTSTRFGNKQITSLGRIWLKDSAMASPAISEFFGIVHQTLLDEGRKILDAFASKGEMPTLADLTAKFGYELTKEMQNMVGDLHSFTFESDGCIQTRPGPFMNFLNRELVAVDRQLKSMMPVSASKVLEDDKAHDFLKGQIGTSNRVTFTVWMSEEKDKDGRDLIVWTQKTFANVFVVSMGMKDGGYEFELKSKDGDPIHFSNRFARSVVVWESPKWFNHKLVKTVRFGEKPETKTQIPVQAQNVSEIEGDIDEAIADIEALNSPRSVNVSEDRSND